MNIARDYFESESYPEQYPSFKRLMAYCDANRVRMSFHEDGGMIGISVYTPDGESITRFGRYTLYFDTTARKMFFLGSEKWEEGMALLTKKLAKAEMSADSDLIDSLGSTIG